MSKITKYSQWSRNCPECNDALYYSCERYLKRAIDNNSVCRKCRTMPESQKQFAREFMLKHGIRPPLRTKEYRKNEVHTHFKDCPRCGNQMGYTSERGLKGSIQHGSLCPSCTAIVYEIHRNYNDTDKKIQNMRATKAGFKSWEEYLEKYPIKKQYKAAVWSQTYKQPLETLDHFSDRGRMGVEGAWQIDHIISIDEGWKKDIPAEKIGHISNLRMLPWKENLLKSNGG